MELPIVNTISNLGAFALLVFVAVWLMRQLPGHFQSLAQERQAREKASVEVAAENRTAIAGLIAAFEKQQAAERDTCERRHRELRDDDDKHHAEVMAGIGELIRRAAETNHEVRGFAQRLSNERALREEKKRPQSKGGAE